MGQQVTELGVGAVVDVVVAPQAQDLALLVSGQLDVHEAGGALAGVGWLVAAFGCCRLCSVVYGFISFSYIVV